MASKALQRLAIVWMFGLTDVAKVPLQMRNLEQAITFIAS
jgi:hypothetical protein